MQIQKMKVLAEAGVVREVEAIAEITGGWVVWITYASRSGHQPELLERQRGGVRVFATLEAVANCLAEAGLTEFRVRVRPP